MTSRNNYNTDIFYKKSKQKPQPEIQMKRKFTNKYEINMEFEE